MHPGALGRLVLACVLFCGTSPWVCSSSRLTTGHRKQDCRRHRDTPVFAAPEPGTSVPFAGPVTVAAQSDDARDPEELAALARPTPVPVAHPSCSAQWGSSVPVPWRKATWFPLLPATRNEAAGGLAGGVRVDVCSASRGEMPALGRPGRRPAPAQLCEAASPSSRRGGPGVHAAAPLTCLLLPPLGSGPSSAFFSSNSACGPSPPLGP